MLRGIAAYVVYRDAFIYDTHGLINMIDGGSVPSKPFFEGSELKYTILSRPWKEVGQLIYEGTNPYTDEEERVNIYVAIPITEKEYAQKREGGFDSLIDYLDDGRIPDDCRTFRKSAI